MGEGRGQGYKLECKLKVFPPTLFYHLNFNLRRNPSSLLSLPVVRFFAP